MLSGLADGYLNRLSYTYSSSTYWTLSPYSFRISNTAAYEFRADSAGYAYASWMTSNYGIRPVINLSSDTQITSGIGTSNDPYVVKVV